MSFFTEEGEHEHEWKMHPGLMSTKSLLAEGGKLYVANL